MKKILQQTAILFLSIFTFSNLQAQSNNWQLDGAHSSVQFAIDHMVISETVGQFKDFALTAKFDAQKFDAANLELTVQANSINTANDKRDGHLKSADFFNAEKYPTITFKSTKIKAKKGSTYVVTGDLTIKDVTKSVDFQVVYSGTIKDPYGKTRAGLKVKGVINRYDFGLEYNSTLETGGLLIGKEVRLNANFEVIQ